MARLALEKKLSFLLEHDLYSSQSLFLNRNIFAQSIRHSGSVLAGIYNLNDGFQLKHCWNDYWLGRETIRNKKAALKRLFYAWNLLV